MRIREQERNQCKKNKKYSPPLMIENATNLNLKSDTEKLKTYA